MIAHDQQFAVDRARQTQSVEQIGKAAGNVFAGPRIEPGDRFAVALPGDRLHADAVPFPFGHEGRRIETGEIGFVQRMRQHRRPERRRIVARRLFDPAFEPGEQVAIGRREARPDQFDFLGFLAAQRRDGGFGKARRDADAQGAGNQLDQRPAPGLVECIEPARELSRQLRFAQCGEGFDHGGETYFSAAARRGGICGPHQRDGFGQIADVVVGQREQHRVGAFGDQAADQAGFGVRESQGPGQRRERPAAFGIDGRTKIIRHQPQLVVAAGLVSQPVEEFGKAVHGVAAPPSASAGSSSSP